MKKLILVSMLSVTLLACERDERMANAPKKSEDIDFENPDRNGRNNRDNMMKPPVDQAESEEDRRITQKIRQIIIADDSLTPNAKNIKIITVKGVVTLRGPVANSREQEDIGKKVREVQGVRGVDNQTEVTRNHY